MQNGGTREKKQRRTEREVFLRRIKINKWGGSEGKELARGTVKRGP